MESQLVTFSHLSTSVSPCTNKNHKMKVSMRQKRNDFNKAIIQEWAWGLWKPQGEMQGKWGGLHHWPLGNFTSPSLSFPIWKSGLMITMRIQCSEVQDLLCTEQGRAHSRCSVHGSGFCWNRAPRVVVDYPCEPKQDKVSEL